MPPRLTLVTDLAARAARRSHTNPWVIAWALARYRRRHGLDEAALAAWLGLPEVQLVQLALCGRPELRSPRFAAQVARIASATGCNAERLAALLTETGGGAA